MLGQNLNKPVKTASVSWFKSMILCNYLDILKLSFLWGLLSYPIGRMISGFRRTCMSSWSWKMKRFSFVGLWVFPGFWAEPLVPPYHWHPHGIAYRSLQLVKPVIWPLGVAKAQWSSTYRSSSALTLLVELPTLSSFNNDATYFLYPSSRPAGSQLCCTSLFLNSLYTPQKRPKGAMPCPLWCPSVAPQFLMSISYPLLIMGISGGDLLDFQMRKGRNCLLPIPLICISHMHSSPEAAPETNIWVYMFGRGSMETSVGERGNETRKGRKLLKSTLSSHLRCDLKQSRNKPQSYPSQGKRELEYLYTMSTNHWLRVDLVGHSFSRSFCLLCEEAQRASTARESHHGKRWDAAARIQAGIIGCGWAPLLAPLDTCITHDEFTVFCHWFLKFVALVTASKSQNNTKNPN